MLATPSSLEWTRANDGSARAVAKCASALNIGRDSARVVATHAPWAAADSAELGRSELVIQVVAQPLSAAACGLDAALDPGVIARGIGLVVGRYPDPAGSVVSIALLRGDGTLVPMQFIAQAPPAYVGGAPLSEAGPAPMMARGYFALGTIAPRRDGTFESLQLVIVAASGATPRVPIAEPTLQRLWPGVAAARLAATGRVGDPSGAFSLPVPRDVELQAARDQLARGEVGAAALRSAVRLSADRLTAFDELSARIMMASGLLAAHDVPAAAATLAPALRPRAALPAAPCLRVAGNAPAELRALIEDLRPRERCAERGAVRALATGLLIPGGAQRANDQRSSGYIVAGFVAAAGLGAFALHQRANQQYDAYQRVTVPILVPDAYRRANNTRHAAVSVLTAGAAVWVAAAIQGGVAAALHDRDLRRVEHYAAAPVVGVGERGLAVGVKVGFGRGNS